MSGSNSTFHQKTPALTVLDSRGLPVRELDWYRHPDTPDSQQIRITRHAFTPAGFPLHESDPRLHSAGYVNFARITDLAGKELHTRSADAGITVILNDAAGRNRLEVKNPGEPVILTRQYESASLPGRMLGVTETAENIARITERFVYAGNSQAERGLNLAGQCVSHYDPAGRVQTESVSLSGRPLSLTRQLLKEADDPATAAGWQGDRPSDWNSMLAAERWTTLDTFNAAGNKTATVDAAGHCQRVDYDVAGQPAASRLRVNGEAEQTIVASLSYSAGGQKQREVHGNGVMTTYCYEPETQRLLRMTTERPSGHPSGARLLQDLNYGYDPAGNIVLISNDAEETRYWNNQKVVPENRYVYDSLYQLVSASGREMANAAQQGSSLPAVTTLDSLTLTNYLRTYRYDSGGNLVQIRHSAPASGNAYTTDITVSDRSNRGVLSSLTCVASDVEALFTPGGLQRVLQPGQTLAWTARNELMQMTPVVRDGAENDHESYRYDAASQRVLKISAQKTGGTMQTQRCLYLPGLELKNSEEEVLQTIAVGEAGRAQVRVLHWVSGRPEGISNNMPRYSYDNMTGSSMLELDGNGEVITREEYHPFGGTAVIAARNTTEAGYKTRRYSGKERDATGLYYYGYRYYQPWAGRWLSADPAGTIDGLNLFRMVSNNPVTLKDELGLAEIPFHDERVNYEIHVAKAVLNEAIIKLQQKKLDQDTKAKIREVFAGSSRHKKIKTSKFKKELLNNFISMRNNLEHAATQYDDESAHVAKGWVASVRPFDHNIRFTSLYFKSIGKITNIVTLLHESSHIDGITRNGYFKTLYGNETARDYGYTIKQMLHVNDVSEYIEWALVDTKKFNEKLRSKQFREQVTEGRGYSRLKTVLHNADHLAITALSLGRDQITPIHSLQQMGRHERYRLPAVAITRNGESHV